MDFNELVEFYERIAATPKRIEMTDILAEAFRACNNSLERQYLRKIIYLTQGQLVSEIQDWPKFGIAEKMIYQVLSKITAKSTEDIRKVVTRKADIGEAVQEILESQDKAKTKYSLDSFQIKQTQKLLTIPKLYEELEKLALTKGEGSQDQKINIIIKLLRNCTPVAAKYVINIIVSNLRIGIADMTIIDSLALAFTNDKKNHDIIEYAYNIHPDLGFIAEILQKDNIEGVRKIQVQIGIPIRMMLASRMPYVQIHSKLGGGDFIAEYKYDGERTQVHKQGNQVQLFSRRLKEITEQYPDVVAAIIQGVDAESIIFEGEIVAMDKFGEKMLPFQIVSMRRRKYDIEKMQKEVPVCLFSFDILYIKRKGELDGRSVMNLPLQERYALLTKAINCSDHLRVAIQKSLNSTESMVNFFKEAREKGAEGIICKAIGPEAIYRAGNRGFLWIKLKGLEGAKMEDTIDVIIIGALWGKGRHSGTFSTLFGAVYNQDTTKFEFFTRIGSGFSDEDVSFFTQKLKELEIERPPKSVVCKDVPDIWVKPEIIVEIMGDELTISNKSDAGSTPDNPNGYSLRFPVFQRIRSDKTIEQITTTKEILDMYNAQM